MPGGTSVASGVVTARVHGPAAGVAGERREQRGGEREQGQHEFVIMQLRPCVGIYASTPSAASISPRSASNPGSPCRRGAASATRPVERDRGPRRARARGRRARIASSTSCVTSSTAGRWRSHSSRSRRVHATRVSASSAPNGSSASSRAGSRTSERASATRCCSPPDSVVRPGALAAGEPDLGERGRGRARAASGAVEARARRCRAPAPTAAAASPGTRPRGARARRARRSRRRRGRARRARAAACVLPGAAAAEQRDELAGGDVEVDAVEHRRGRRSRG